MMIIGRKWFYESFWIIHVIMSLFFLGALFWHGYSYLDTK